VEVDSDIYEARAVALLDLGCRRSSISVSTCPHEEEQSIIERKKKKNKSSTPLDTKSKY